MILMIFLVTSLTITQSLYCMDNPQQLLITNNIAISALQNQYNSNITQFLENPDVSQRIKKEITELLITKNRTFIFDVYSVNSKTHPYETKITLYDKETDESKTVQHILTCKIPVDYPFKAPFLLLESKDPRFLKDVITIKNSLKGLLAERWSPALTISHIINMTYEKIKLYKKVTLTLIDGQEKTLDHLKAKYQNNKIILGDKYPEFQEKLRGLWIKKTPLGYLVFHINGDYIDISFEFKDINTKPLFYHGNCAIGYYDTNENKFNVHITDDTDLGKINGFNIYVFPSYISLQFFSLQHNSILESIISQIEINYDIGEYIDLSKIE